MAEKKDGYRQQNCIVYTTSSSSSSRSSIINFYFQHVASVFAFWVFLFHCTSLFLCIAIFCCRCWSSITRCSLYAMYSTQQTNISLRFIISMSNYSHSRAKFRDNFHSFASLAFVANFIECGLAWSLVSDFLCSCSIYFVDVCRLSELHRIVFRTFLCMVEYRKWNFHLSSVI